MSFRRRAGPSRSAPALSTDTEHVESVTVRLETLRLGELLNSAGDASLEFRRRRHVGDLPAAHTQQMMVVLGEILGELETSELVVGRHSPHEAGALEVDEVAIGRAARKLRQLAGDVTDADGVPGGGEQLDDSAPAGRVSLIDAAKARSGHFVQAVGTPVG